MARPRLRLRARLHRTLLRVWALVPMGLRRVVVRTVAPSYTVGAICVIERPDGNLLLVRSAYRDDWGLPGGLLDRGEEPAECARREVFEEIGMAIELIEPPAVVVDPEPQRVDVVFRARPMSLAEVSRARARSAEIVEIAWFAPDALPQLQTEAAEAIVALARQRAAGARTGTL